MQKNDQFFGVLILTRKWLSEAKSAVRKFASKIEFKFFDAKIRLTLLASLRSAIFESKSLYQQIGSFYPKTG